ncbi:MAG: DUF1853 family protein [Gammaproteobacteria bacterium]|nr:DUF1853 family protein [Gammaproteobacteria bacterium]
MPAPSTAVDLTARIVRDIEWVVGSQPLLLPPGDERFPSAEWFTQQLAELEPQLQALKADPAACETLESSITPLRLGGYFEQLILWWLDNSENYEVLAHNLQVNSQGRTLGAFDLIVKNHLENTTEHWELACKFYLQDGDSSKIESWFGPARKDKLVEKYQHLLNHQIALSQHPDGFKKLAEQGWEVDRHRIIVKGRLFGDFARLPDEVNPDCLKGWLSTANQYQSRENDLPLQRQHWMSPIIAGDIAAPNADTAHRHGCLCLVQIEGEREISRGFVVPDDWTQQSKSN